MKAHGAALAIGLLLSHPALASGVPGNMETTALRATLSTLDVNDPSADAHTNFFRGDFRFIAIRDYSCHLPGREGIKLEHLASRYGIRCVEGTTDTPESDEHAALLRIAARYGVLYNETLRGLLTAPTGQAEGDH